MTETAKETAARLLSEYIEANNMRHTPERSAVLSCVYSFSAPFAIEDLAQKLHEQEFPISRPTLYNSLKLFEQIRIVNRITLPHGTFYAPFNQRFRFMMRRCSYCGKTDLVKSQSIVGVVESTPLKRFRQDSFSLVIFGVCSSCQARITKLRRRGR